MNRSSFGLNCVGHESAPHVLLGVAPKAARMVGRDTQPDIQDAWAPPGPAHHFLQLQGGFP